MNPERNRSLIFDVLSGSGESAHQAAIAINAAVLIELFGVARSYKQAADMAIASMQSGAPLDTIQAAAISSKEG